MKSILRWFEFGSYPARDGFGRRETRRTEQERERQGQRRIMSIATPVYSFESAFVFVSRMYTKNDGFLRDLD